ncbi:MAG: PQQ-dependent sugar dehydrogenase [Acidobacteriota bacterium]
MCKVFLTLLLPLGLIAQEIRLNQIVTGTSAPTDIQSAGDGTDRLFLAEQGGRIRILRAGALLPQVFLDISALVSSGNERGLLGLAFPPGFAQSQRFYVDYTNRDGNTVIAQYRVSANRDVADPASAVILLTIPQPFANHNGGQVRFGPDGFLYIGLGDGGSGGDPQNNGQNLNALLGKLLRIDVESAPGTVRIPPSNPFVNRAGARGEIWAYGLRNPWRFSFDRANGDLWIADVGQDNYEEVNYQPSESPGGEDYGWRIMEGLHCYNPSNCNMQGLTLPVAEYSHAGSACSITGGFVYRGQMWPGLRGTYIYADYCSGRIWGLDRSGSNWVTRVLLDSGLGITTFGQDEAGEVYLAAANGRIYRVDLLANVPRFYAANVVNAASFAGGAVAGSLATVFAAGVRDTPGFSVASGLPLPPTMDGIALSMDGISAPLLSVSNLNGVEQVNFQVPFELQGRTSAALVISRAGASSAPQTVTLQAQQPGVYTLDGTRAIAVHNTSYTLVTDPSPLAAGEFAFLYASGLGAVTNAPVTGAAAASSPLARTVAQVHVTLGGLPCEVQFSGLAPGFAGLYQVNFRVPTGLAKGVYDLQLSVGAENAPVVKLPVQ